MEKFGTLLKKCAREVQPCVEDIVGIELGDVQVRPLSESFNDMIKRYDENPVARFTYTKREWKRSLWLSEFFLYPLAKAENSTVYYSQSPLSSFFPGIFVPNVAAHELAHCKVLGRDSLLATNTTVSDEFADYVAEKVCSRLGKPVASFSRKSAVRFHELLAKEGLPDTIAGAVSYLRFEHQRSEEKQKLYDSF